MFIVLNKVKLPWFYETASLSGH